MMFKAIWTIIGVVVILVIVVMVLFTASVGYVCVEQVNKKKVEVKEAALRAEQEIKEAAARAKMKESQELFDLFHAIGQVESGGNVKAYNRKKKAAGIVQIRPICVADCNRIVQSERWSLSDRYDPSRSFEMFKVYTTHYKNHYGLTGQQAAARIWYGGPRGWKKKSTLRYWAKVKKELEAGR